MVLSPMDPVAPSTVTVRTADTAALLLRSGTALMLSPNHKTASDAIQAASQEANGGSQNDGEDEPVKTVQKPTVPRNDLARVLDAETPLHRGLQEVAELGSHRQHSSQHQDRDGLAQTEAHKTRRNGQARREAADRARPGLLGADTWPEFRSAHAAAGEITTNVGDPHHQQNQHQPDESFRPILTH